MDFEETIPAGAMWSMRVPKYRVIRLTAIDAGANVSALFYNATNPLDRLNVPDTLKALHTAKLTKGHVLMSDMGNAMVSVVDDSLGWHDPLGGHSTGAHVEAAFGVRRYQEARNEFHRNARDNFLIELSKHGLGIQDLVANVNLFSKVESDSEGKLRWVADHCPAKAFIELRTEIDVLVVMANCPHPMNAGRDYPLSAVKITIHPCEPPGADDYCYNFRPECSRAIEIARRQFI